MRILSEPGTQAGPSPQAGQEGPSIASEPAGHLGYIDGLRGLAILMVLLYHVWRAANNPADFWWNPLASGYTGVNLFLVLSGFCLYWPLVKPVRPAPEPRLIDFARRRAHRLLPAYYIALGLFTALNLLWERSGRIWPEGTIHGQAAVLKAAAWHLLLVQNLRPNALWAIDSPLWTLALEVSLYVAIPILVVTARKTRIEWAVALATLVTLAYRLGVDRFVGGAAGWDTLETETAYVLADFLPGRWVEFALGMWAAALVGSGASRRSRVPFGLLALLCFLSDMWLRARYGQHNPLSEPLFGLSFFFLVLWASRAPLARGFALGRFLRARFLVWLGVISYSVYLLHQPILWILIGLGRPHFSRARDIFASCVFLFLPIVIGISFLFYVQVERRFLNKPRAGRAPGLPGQIG